MATNDCGQQSTDGGYWLHRGVKRSPTSRRGRLRQGSAPAGVDREGGSDDEVGSGSIPAVRR